MGRTIGSLYIYIYFFLRGGVVWEQNAHRTSKSWTKSETRTETTTKTRNKNKQTEINLKKGSKMPPLGTPNSSILNFFWGSGTLWDLPDFYSVFKPMSWKKCKTVCTLRVPFRLPTGEFFIKTSSPPSNFKVFKKFQVFKKYI